MISVPTPLTRYMQGLRAHDIDLIGSTFSDDTRFVTPVRTMQKAQILEFLQALYTGFPNWSYENDAPEGTGGSCWRVNWLQGGTHTNALALPGFPIVPATGRQVQIPKHFFYYEVTSDVLLEIRPDPVPGGAPRGYSNRSASNFRPYSGASRLRLPRAMKAAGRTVLSLDRSPTMRSVPARRKFQREIFDRAPFLNQG